MISKYVSNYLLWKITCSHAAIYRKEKKNYHLQKKKKKKKKEKKKK